MSCVCPFYPTSVVVRFAKYFFENLGRVPLYNPDEDWDMWLGRELLRRIPRW